MVHINEDISRKLAGKEAIKLEEQEQAERVEKNLRNTAHEQLLHKVAGNEAGRLEDQEQKDRVYRDQTVAAAQAELLRTTGAKEAVRSQEAERKEEGSNLLMYNS